MRTLAGLALVFSCLITGCGSDVPSASLTSGDASYVGVFALVKDAGGTLDSMLSVKPAERTALKTQSWRDMQGSFRALSEAGADSTPLYRCYDIVNGQPAHYFGTEPTCGGHIPEATLGYLGRTVTAATPNALHLCSHSAGTRAYVFPTQGMDCPSGSTDKGILGYVQAPDQSKLGSGEIVLPPAPYRVTFVYRLHNPASGDFLLTGNPSEAQTSGYRYEGPAFSVLDNQINSDMIALYRCHTTDGKHFVSKASDCEGGILESRYGWVFSKAGGLASSAGAIFRFKSPTDASIRVTTTQQEGTRANFIVDEPQGYQIDAEKFSDADVSAPAFAYAAGNETIAVNEEDPNFTYAYAPSIMKLPNGQYYMWACSGISSSGDSIIFTSSTDGINWTPQTIALHSFDALNPEKDDFYSHACDPSVVQFAPDPSGPTYYYMFLSTTKKSESTVNIVARSLTPAGPFSVFTGGDPKDANNWTTNVDPAHLPYVIQKPTVRCPDPVSCYGAGEPSVVLRNGTLQMWYTDTTATPWGVLYTTSTDGVNWTPAQTTNAYSAPSIDVKFDPESGKYLMAALDDMQLADTRLTTYLSTDGISWKRQEVYGGDRIPPFSHNLGIAGDPSGFLLTGASFIGFGAPYRLGDFSYVNGCDTASNGDLCQGHWHLWITPFFPLFQSPPLSQ